MKMILGVICGYVLWTVVFLGGSTGIARSFPEEQEAFEAGGSYTATVPLVLTLLLSMLSSVAAGASSSRIGSGNPKRTATITGVLLLLTGIGVQVSTWSRFPVWYNLLFLALLLPITVMSARKA